MKKLPRAIMRKEDEPGYEKQLWQPTWNCFCCHDSGIVRSHLAEIVIDGYDSFRDKLPRCHNYGCSAGDHYDNSSELSKCMDYRLSPEMCQELDVAEREAWRQTLAEWHRTGTRQQIDFSKVVRSLRTVDRTNTEQMEALRRKEEVMARIDRRLNPVERQEVLLRTGEINDL
jgi:hypothetical protein